MYLRSKETENNFKMTLFGVQGTNKETKKTASRITIFYQAYMIGFNLQI